MAVFRIEKTRDYTVMSNHHLRDQSLSLKAKGLLSMMLSLPEEWNYTTRGLASICKEGADSIGSALKELERTGYIVRNRLWDSKGKILDVEYVIYETPHPPAEPDTAAPDTAFPYPENPDMDIPCLEKPSQLNIDRESIYRSKKDSVNTDRPNLILSNPPTRSMVEALEDYIDFEAYGHDVAQGEGGKLAEYCYVFPSGSEFYEEYNGDLDTIPDEYVVYTPDLLNLDPDEKLAWAIPLAISLDSFFREFDSGYAEQHPDISAQQEFLCDSLVDGKIAAIDKRLSDMGQTEQDALPSELADFKRLSGYDPETENLPETMKVLVVEPRQPPRVKEIPSGLEGLTDAVGGPISAIYPFHDPVALICNDEGRNMGLELNRALYNGMGQVYDVIPGTFVIAGLTDDSFTSLPEDMIEKYSRRFQTIEVYAQVGNRTVMFQVPQDTAELSDQCWDSVIREKLGQKPSIRESLAAAKEECAGKPAPERIHNRSEHEL